MTEATQSSKVMVNGSGLEAPKGEQNTNAIIHFHLIKDS